MTFSTTNALVLTGVIVTVGKWSQDEPLSTNIVVGGTVAAVSLAGMHEVAPELASKFALVIVVVAAFTYLPSVLYKLGLTNIAPPIWGAGPTVKRSRKARA